MYLCLQVCPGQTRGSRYRTERLHGPVEITGQIPFGRIDPLFSLHLRPEREVIPDDEADEAVITAETERQLLRLIEELPRECRKVLKHSLRGKSYKEIGEILRISVSTVHSQRVRAVKLLRQAFVKLF